MTTMLVLPSTRITSSWKLSFGDKRLRDIHTLPQKGGLLAPRNGDLFSEKDKRRLESFAATSGATIRTGMLRPSGVRTVTGDTGG